MARRDFIRGAGAVGIGSLVGAAGGLMAGQTTVLPVGNGDRPLVQYPQKRPLILQTSRPPQLETPFQMFDEGAITPNDAFFVRYHLAGIPTEVDPDAFRLSVKGKVNKPLDLSLDDLRKLEPIEYVAVNQCSGNSRAFSNPRVAGGQLGNGAMGNARWRGVSLKTVLELAGLQAGARQVRFDGMDGPVLPGTPDFAKALDVDHANDGEVMLAYSMNDADLPLLNGYPLRLVVPGYFGTYWVKHLNEITVLDTVLDNFWMATAYRIPDNPCACVVPGSAAKKTVPIARFPVRSFITNVQEGATVRAGRSVLLRGIAFDGGYGIRAVDVSITGGRTWSPAELGKDLGKYSFRQWQARVVLPKGPQTLQVRAMNAIGQSQPLDPLWNPAGYMRNVVETTHVMAA
ncbi:MAG: molybdopterin-dependent oxidoreductase [Proteobacteria bacterium]|nr:molybdopterin-dependent oxidoreductase [Pseudomonadota bacterium]